MHRGARTQAAAYLAAAFSIIVVFIVFFGAGHSVSGQIQYSSGQGVFPDFEGWEANPDGSYDMVFGYMNRNYEERPHVPIGPNNKVEPGSPDQGQPTYFLPRRNRNVMRIRVPSNFGNKEVVWTVTANGKTASAYGTLKPDYAIDQGVVYLNNSGFSRVGRAMRNKAPEVTIVGETQRTARIGESLTVEAIATDDGIPAPRPAPRGMFGFRTALGLRVAWFVYRGAGDTVSFDPEQFKVYADYLDDAGNSPYAAGWAPPPLPRDGKFPVKATFNQPGTFVLRVLAHDGGYETARDVTVTVEPMPAKAAR